MSDCVILFLTRKRMEAHCKAPTVLDKYIESPVSGFLINLKLFDKKKILGK